MKINRTAVGIMLLTSALFFACAKDDEAPDAARDAFAAFQGKYLICDSIKTTLNGRNTTQVLGKGKGNDLSFGLYGNLDIYSSPAGYKSYQFQTPDKVYYWATTYQTTQFYTIQSISGKKIVLIDSDPSSGKVFIEYFTAE